MISAAAVWEEESPGWEMRNCTINIAAAGKQESIVHNYIIITNGLHFHNKYQVSVPAAIAER